MNTDLSELEWDILNCLYFVEPFSTLLEETGYPAPIVADGLKTLIHRKMVVPMRFDETKQEYLRTFYYDADNMDAYSYLATKEGLMAHNSR
ncbi:MAG: hypothetical protein LCH37_12060 [Bacteroidetes bacterium]|nr:hypothetical protein [Bacteroidota bacterium]MCK6610462.1 hypothetical protein [Bacteroidia bacterium]